MDKSNLLRIAGFIQLVAALVMAVIVVLMLFSGAELTLIAIAPVLFLSTGVLTLRASRQ